MTSSERRVLDQKLNEVANGRLDSLQLNGNHLFGDDITRIAQVIRHAPNLRSLGINTGLNEAAVDLIAEAVGHRSDLRDFGLTNIRISPENARKLALGLAPNRSIKRLQFSWSVPEGAVLDHLSGLIADLPRLQQVFLSGGEWSQQSHDRLAEALADKKDLVSLEMAPSLNENATEKERELNDDALEEALLRHPHPNLTHFGGNSSPHIGSMMEAARQRQDATKQFLQPFAQVAPNDYPGFAARMTPHRIADIEAQYAGLAGDGAFNHAIDGNYRHFLEHLPRLPVPLPELGLEEALFAPDAEDFTPLENPRTWREHPGLLEHLAAEAPLTQERLSRRTPKGMSLLEAAFAHLPAADVLATLNKAHVQVQRRELLEGGDKPTPLLHILLTKHEAGSLFTQENWLGASSGAMMACIRDLPAEARLSLPSLAGLRLQLDAQARAQAGKGR